MRRIVLWAVLGVIALLLILSVVGAFLGPDRAWLLFNSTPLAVFWLLLTGLLIAGFVCFKRLLRQPGLLTVHLGSVLILGGAMYGSVSGHRLAQNLTGREKIPYGFMKIYEGQSSNLLLDGDFKQQIAELPFSLHLRDFRIEYYDKPPGQIRDYKSDLVVLEQGREVAQRVIEVNHPLYYGGYHFYQEYYDERAGRYSRYTILLVVSDSGLIAVYAGFALLVGGLFWQFWGRPIRGYLSSCRTDVV